MSRVNYEAVADVYTEALENREPVNSRGRATPIVAVALTFDVPYDTAARWVKQARRKGVLAGPAPRCSGRCGLHCAVLA